VKKAQCEKNMHFYLPQAQQAMQRHKHKTCL